MENALYNLNLEQPEGGSRLRDDIRVLLKLATPIIGITLSRMLMGFADFYQVSYLGTNATAAISPATMLVFAALCFGMGATTSVQTFTAQSVGRGRPTDAPKYAAQGLYLVLFSLPIAAILSYFSATIWHKINAPPEVQSLQISFCRIAFWSMPLGIACGALESFFNGIQKPSVALKAVIVALACVIIGNYLLIFGKFGFPRLGVAGAAIATVIGWSLRLTILASVYFSREFRERYHTHQSWKLDLAKLRSIIGLGGPTAIQWVLDILAWFLFLSLILQHLSTETLAASNTAIQYMNIAFMPVIGVGIALCSLVGQAIGRGKPEVAVRKTRAALLVSVLYMAFIAIFFVIIPRQLMGVISDDPLVIEIGVGVLLWAALFQVSDGFSIIYINALRGAGDTRWPAVILVGLCWTIFLFGGWAVGHYVPQWKHHGPWMMCTLYITILGIVLWRRFESGAWRKIKLFHSQSIVQQSESNVTMAIENPTPESLGVIS